MTGHSAYRQVASQRPIELSSTCPCMPSSSQHSHTGRIPAAIAAAGTTQMLNGPGGRYRQFLFLTPPLDPGEGDSQTICISWNGGACKFLTLCNFRHICSSCYSTDRISMDCPSWSSKRQTPNSLPPGREGQRRPRMEEPSTTR